MISVEYRSVRSLFVLTLVAVMCSCVSSYAQATLGDIRGVTRNSKGQPLSNVQIVVNPVGTGGFNTGKVVAGSVTATSGSDGAFVVQNLNPGQYQLLAQKAGFEPSKPSSVDVAAGESRRSDIVLAANEMPDVSAHGVGSINPDTPSRSTLAADPEIPPAVAKELQSMRDLIGQLQAELNSRKASEQPSTATEENLAKASEREPALLAASRGLSTAPSSEVPAIGIPAVQQGLAAAPAAPPAVDTVTPFAYADWTWLNGNPRNKDAVWDSKFFTPEVRFDTHFMTDFNQPRDHTMGGATESFRSG